MGTFSKTTARWLGSLALIVPLFILWQASLGRPASPELSTHVLSNLPESKSYKMKGQNKTLRNMKLLTIFTSFKGNSERTFAENNTIVNWSSFGDKVQPISFSNVNTLTKHAINRGWLWSPQLRSNSYGTPFLKDMYEKAFELSNSYFYGFTNGDILFDQGLIKTLETIRREATRFNKTTLTIGRRTNVNITKVYDKLAAQNSTIFKKLSKSRGHLYSTIALDYFFISNLMEFPWDHIADVVIGRPAYDNYLVGKSLRANVSVIDATKSLLALHEIGKEGLMSGHRNKDGTYNRKKLGRYKLGSSNDAQYFTKQDSEGKIIVVARPRRT